MVWKSVGYLYELYPAGFLAGMREGMVLHDKNVLLITIKHTSFAYEFEAKKIVHQ